MRFNLAIRDQIWDLKVAFDAQAALFADTSAAQRRDSDTAQEKQLFEDCASIALNTLRCFDINDTGGGIVNLCMLSDIFAQRTEKLATATTPDTLQSYKSASTKPFAEALSHIREDMRID